MSAPLHQLSPLHFEARRLGAQFSLAGGWQVAQVYTSVEAEAEAARKGVGLADETANFKILIEGRQAGEVLGVDLEIGAGIPLEKEWVYRLRQDLFFLHGAGEAQALEGLRGRVAGRFVTIADITHGRAELRLVGPASLAVLSAVCSLDFERFPDRAARQGSLAKTAQLLIRRDLGGLPAFSIIGARSLGAYLWEGLLRVGREWGITPVGQAALRALEGTSRRNPHHSQGDRP